MIKDFKLTPSVRDILERMQITGEPLTRANPGGWWVGNHRIGNNQAPWVLVWWAIVRADEQDWEKNEITYFTLARDLTYAEVFSPGFEPPMVAALREKGQQ